MQVILDSIITMEEVDVTTDKVYELIRPLVDAVENLGTENDVKKANEMIFRNKFRKFEESLQKEYKQMDTSKFIDWRRGPNIPDAKKALSYIREKYDQENDDQAISYYFLDPAHYAEKIIQHQGFVNYHRHENYSGLWQ